MQLRSGTDQNEIGSPVRGIGQNISAPAQPFGRGEPTAVERRHVLSSKHESHWTVARFDRDLPRNRRLVGIARPNNNEPRYGAKRGQLFDGLVRRAVFTEPDAVVG